jgi:serine/threonine protein kinase
MDKMVRIPVKFRDSLGISEDIKNFIRKCLEVDEEKRMSLSEMKNWNSSNSNEKLLD